METGLVTSECWAESDWKVTFLQVSYKNGRFVSVGPSNWMHQLARHSNSHTSMSSVRSCLESKERHGWCQGRKLLSSCSGRSTRRTRCLDYVQFINTAHCWHCMLEHLDQAHQTKHKMAKSLIKRPTGLPMGRNLRNRVIHILVENSSQRTHCMKTQHSLQGVKHFKQIYFYRF